MHTLLSMKTNEGGQGYSVGTLLTQFGPISQFQGDVIATHFIDETVGMVLKFDSNVPQWVCSTETHYCSQTSTYSGFPGVEGRGAPLPKLWRHICNFRCCACWYQVTSQPEQPFSWKKSVCLASWSKSLVVVLGYKKSTSLWLAKQPTKKSVSKDILMLQTCPSHSKRVPDMS